MISSEQFQKSIEQSTASWGSSYAILKKIIETNGFEIGAEVGVAYGGNAENVLQIEGVEKFYGVDPYRHREDVTDTMNFSQEDFDDICKHTLQRLSKYGNRFELVRKLSVEAVNHVPDNLDFVYIDGNHSYHGVLDDLGAWFFKVKDGGILCGDDYNHPDLPGVKKSVDAFFRRFDWNVNVEDRVWWVEKKPLHVSFFIPTYNYGKSIAEAVDSIMQENFLNGDELVIVDDGSTDNTAKFLLDLKNKYSEIRIITHSRNRGPAATRNTAVENCRNSIVFSHDQDNILIPGSIQRLKNFLITSGADVAVFGEVRFFAGTSNNVTHSWFFKKEPYTLQDCLSDHHVPGADGNYLFTKESWIRAGGYPDSWLDSWGFGFRQIATLQDSYYLHQHRHEHDYESTFMKGERTGKISSLNILAIIVPFIFLLDTKSANYIMSEWGRTRWFKRLKERPLKVQFATIEEYEQHKKPNVPIKKYQIFKRVLTYLRKRSR